MDFAPKNEQEHKRKQIVIIFLGSEILTTGVFVGYVARVRWSAPSNKGAQMIDDVSPRKNVDQVGDELAAILNEGWLPQEVASLGTLLSLLSPQAKRVKNLEEGGRYRALNTFDGKDACLVTVERFGESVIAWDVQEPEAQDFFCAAKHAGPVLCLDFGPSNNEALTFYNALPENMRGWRKRQKAKETSLVVTTAEAGASNTKVTGPPEYVDFLEDLRRARVRDTRPGHSGYYRVPRHEVLTRWNVPVYDFGGILYPQEPDYMGADLEQAMRDTISDFGIDQLPIAEIFPNEQFVFIFRLTRDVDGHKPFENTVLIHIGGDDIRFFFCGGDHAWRYVADATSATDLPNDETSEFAIAFLRLAILAAQMLKAWELDVEQFDVQASAKRDRINRKRKLNHEPIVPPTRVIHLSEHRVQRLREHIKGLRTMQRGHEKGRHLRTYRDLESVVTRRRRDGGVTTYIRRIKAKTIVVKPNSPPAAIKEPRSVPLTPSITFVTR